jgi:sugar-phosphatase
MPILHVVSRAVLFDMDGVLVDSTRAVARVWSEWATQHGFDPEHVSRIAQGRPSITTLRELLPDADHESENRIVERREIETVDGTVACRGAAELLAVLPRDRWMLVTSSTRPLAEARLRAAGLAVPENFVTSSDVRLGKPHPEPFLKAAAKLGINPADALVVEDSPAGIQSGKAAGCRVLALRTTMPESDLKSAGPNWIVDDCSALRFVGTTSDGALKLAIE